MTSFILKSIERKFLAIMLLALLIVNGSILATFSVITRVSLENDIRSKKDSLLAANSKALSEPLWNYDFNNLEEIAESIALDPDIASVTIFNDRSETVASARKEFKAGEAPDEQEIDVRRKTITHQVGTDKVRVGVLRIAYLRDRIDAAIQNEIERSVVLFIASALAVLLGAAVLNRFMVYRPLSQLTSAIEATRRRGKRQRVDWQSGDEIGQVVHNFNEMQDRLEQEEAQLRRAHNRLSNFYNNTPVMLYSVDANDIIVDVSDYWLDATGYERTDVIDTAFTDFLTEDSLDAYRARRDLSSLAAGERCVSYCKFRKKHGSVIDVLISEKADLDHDGGPQRSLSVMTNITDLKAAEAKIRRQAHTDILTSLANRAGFAAAAETAVANALDDGSRLCVLYFDVDRFKWLNDSLGHHAGDEILKTAASRIQTLLDQADIFARLGGDEFAVLLKGRNLRTRATALASLISDTLQTPIEIEGRDVNVTASIGLAFYPKDAQTADDLLKAADVAMYSQKRKGRNGYCLFDRHMGLKAARQLEVERHIIDGLENDWIELHLQPIVDLHSGKTVGFEGLVRLNHPDEGYIHPDEIISIAEENGSIHRLGDRILDLGLHHIDALREYPEFEDTYLTVNLSAAQFLPGLPARLASLLMAHKIGPDHLVLEITESVFMQTNPELEEIFENISRLGCKFALDDFGTGYSSLSYLSNFPVDIVKIDREFIQALVGRGACEATDKARTLVRGITTLARDMNLTIVAEGIETDRQHDILKTMELDFGQGYLFGRPQPLESYLESVSIEEEKLGTACA